MKYFTILILIGLFGIFFVIPESDARYDLILESLTEQEVLSVRII